MVTDVLAQSTVGNPLGAFAPYADLGVIVLFFALFFFGKLRRESEIKERDERIKKLESAAEANLEHYQKEVLPALIEVTKVSGEIVAYLNKRRS